MKWLSNSREVLESLPESERASVVRDLDFSNDSVERALRWFWSRNLPSNQRRRRQCEVLVCDGQIKTCPNQASNNSPHGIIGSGPGNKAG